MIASRIQKPRDGKVVKHKEGNTQNIIDVLLIVAADKRIVEDVQAFVKDNKLTASEKDLYKLWHFTRHKIRYVADGLSQDIQYPSALWSSKRGDCKSKTIFIVSCLQVLNIDYIIRFATYSPSSRNVTHVYPVAIINGKEIILDAVWDKFNEQKTPAYRVLDYTKMEVSTISGVGSYGSREMVGKIGDKLKARIRDFILKKGLKSFVYAFIDFPVEGKSKRKMERQKKILDFLSRKFNIPMDVLLRNARAGIKKKFKKEPEVMLAAFVAHGRGVKGIGCVDPITCAATISAIGGALIKLVIDYQKKKMEIDGGAVTDDDFEVDLEELAADTKISTKQFVNKAKNNGKKK